MKRTIPLLLAAFLLSTLLSVPVQAAEAADATKPGRDSAYYPISVEEYTAGDFDELRIQKVYQLSLDDDPSLIPTEDFERNGRLYYLLDMTRKDEVGVDTKPHVQTVTMPSDTNNMEKILQTLDAEIETVTEDGYTGKRGQRYPPGGGSTQRRVYCPDQADQGRYAPRCPRPGQRRCRRCSGQLE